MAELTAETVLVVKEIVLTVLGIIIFIVGLKIFLEKRNVRAIWE